jgi:hypothetical protein
VFEVCVPYVIHRSMAVPAPSKTPVVITHAERQRISGTNASPARRQ